MNNTIIKKIFVLIFSCLFMAYSSDSIVASRQSGSLCIQRKSDTKMEVEMYQVADYEHGEYILKPAFQEKDIESYHEQLVHNEALNAKQLEEYADLVVKTAHKQKLEPIYKGWLQTETQFQNMSLGLYVLAQVDHKEDQTKILPVVVGVPYWQKITMEDGSLQNQLVFDVTMQVKETDVKPPKPPIEETGPTDTGDDASHQTSIYMTMLIASMMGMYWIGKRLSSGIDYEK